MERLLILSWSVKPLKPKSLPLAVRHAVSIHFITFNHSFMMTDLQTGVDLWLLGVGTNGHVAFNEPGSTPDSRARLVGLSPATIKANSDGTRETRESNF